MDKPLERMYLAGLGMLTITKEKAEKMVDELVKKGEIARKDQPDFVKKLIEKGKDTRKEVEKIVEDTTRSVLDKLELSTKRDIEELSKKLDALAKKIKK